MRAIKLQKLLRYPKFVNPDALVTMHRKLFLDMFYKYPAKRIEVLHLINMILTENNKYEKHHLQ